MFLYTVGQPSNSYPFVIQHSYGNKKNIFIDYNLAFGGFHKWGTSKIDGLFQGKYGKMLKKWMIWGYPHDFGNHHVAIQNFWFSRKRSPKDDPEKFEVVQSSSRAFSRFRGAVANLATAVFHPQPAGHWRATELRWICTRDFLNNENLLIPCQIVQVIVQHEGDQRYTNDDPTLDTQSTQTNRQPLG